MAALVGACSVPDDQHAGNPTLAFCHASLSGQLRTQQASVHIDRIRVQEMDEFAEWLDLAIEYETSNELQVARFPFRRSLLARGDWDDAFYGFFDTVVDAINEDIVVFLPMMAYLRATFPAYDFGIDLKTDTVVDLYAAPICRRRSKRARVRVECDRRAIKDAYARHDETFYRQLFPNLPVPRETAQMGPVLARKSHAARPIRKMRKPRALAGAPRC